MQKGQKMSQEQKDKISKSHKGMKKPWSGKWMAEEDRLAISNRMKGNTQCLGRKLKPETIEKIRQSNLGKKHNISDDGMARMKVKNYEVWNKGKDTKKSYVCGNCGKEFKSHLDSKFCSVECSIPHRSKEKHYRWIEDRTKVKLDKDRGGPLHKRWSKDIKKRDGWKCKLSSKECILPLQAHHIVSWSENVELRYVLSNGITLCKFHHPTKKLEEKQLAPLFRKLILD